MKRIILMALFFMAVVMDLRAAEKVPRHKMSCWQRIVLIAGTLAPLIDRATAYENRCVNPWKGGYTGCIAINGLTTQGFMKVIVPVCHNPNDNREWIADHIDRLMQYEKPSVLRVERSKCTMYEEEVRACIPLHKLRPRGDILYTSMDWWLMKEKGETS